MVEIDFTIKRGQSTREQSWRLQARAEVEPPAMTLSPVQRRLLSEAAQDCTCPTDRHFDAKHPPCGKHLMLARFVRFQHRPR